MENTHIKIQYHNEELTVQEICERLGRAEHDRDRAINQLKGDCRMCAHMKQTWNNGTVIDCPLWNNCSNGDKWEWYCEED